MVQQLAINYLILFNLTWIIPQFHLINRSQWTREWFTQILNSRSRSSQCWVLTPSAEVDSPFGRLPFLALSPSPVSRSSYRYSPLSPDSPFSSQPMNPSQVHPLHRSLFLVWEASRKGGTEDPTDLLKLTLHRLSSIDQTVSVSLSIIQPAVVEGKRRTKMRTPVSSLSLSMFSSFSISSLPLSPWTLAELRMKKQKTCISSPSHPLFWYTY